MVRISRLLYWLTCYPAVCTIQCADMPKMNRVGGEMQFRGLDVPDKDEEMIVRYTTHVLSVHCVFPVTRSRSLNEVCEVL